MIPSISTPTADSFAATTRPGWGPVTTAAFRTVTELQAAGDDDELTARLGELDRSRLEDIARQGYLDGHDQGVRDGYREGQERAMAEVGARFTAALGALGAAARQLGALDAVTLAEIDAQVTGLALEVAGHVIGHELAATTDPGADALARAIALAPDRGALVARLHPDDLATLGTVDGLAPGREVTLVADAGVQPGGCVLEAGACRIDAQIGTALGRVAAVLGTGTPR